MATRATPGFISMFWTVMIQTGIRAAYLRNFGPVHEDDAMCDWSGGGCPVGSRQERSGSREAPRGADTMQTVEALH